MAVAVLVFIVNVIRSWRSGPARRQRPLAGGYAGVVRDLAAARAQLRPRPLRHEPPAAPRPPPPAPRAASDGLTHSRRPGPWLRLTALALASPRRRRRRRDRRVGPLARGGRARRARAPRSASPLSAWFGHRDRPRPRLRGDRRARRSSPCRSGSAASSPLPAAPAGRDGLARRLRRALARRDARSPRR